MDDSLKDIEAELKRLRPRPPSPELLARIERAIEQTEPGTEIRPSPAEPAPRSGFSWRLFWPAAAGLASAVWLVVAYSERPAWPQPTEAQKPAIAQNVERPRIGTRAFKPVGAAELRYASFKSGVIPLADGSIVRRVCDRYVDVYTWRNPHTNASIQWTLPREEVRVEPIDVF